MRLGLTLSVLRTARALQQLTRHGSRPALRRGAVVAAEPPARPRARAPRATGKLRQLPHAPKADELLRRAGGRRVTHGLQASGDVRQVVPRLADLFQGCLQNLLVVGQLRGVGRPG